MRLGILGLFVAEVLMFERTKILSSLSPRQVVQDDYDAAKSLRQNEWQSDK
jgi:hypothetical protein